MLRLLTIILAAGALAGCGSMIADRLPTDFGGLPTATPARPAEAQEYPAVHDSPPPRAVPALTVEQQQKVEDDLRATRDHQEQVQDKVAADPKSWTGRYLAEVLRRHEDRRLTRKKALQPARAKAEASA